MTEKLFTMMGYIFFEVNDQVFHVSSYFYCIEFQMRGAPHVHSLLWLRNLNNVFGVELMQKEKRKVIQIKLLLTNKVEKEIRKKKWNILIMFKSTKILKRKKEKIKSLQMNYWQHLLRKYAVKSMKIIYLTVIAALIWSLKLASINGTHILLLGPKKKMYNNKRNWRSWSLRWV